MNMRWQRALRAAVVSGSIASLASLVGLVLGGRMESGRMAAPVNAPSHWLWGDRALRRDGASLRYTLAGFLIHHASSIFWAALHGIFFGVQPKPPARTLLDACATTALAAWVDLRVVPHRLTPGFQHRLSSGALLAVYLLFGAGLAAGNGWATRDRR